MAAAATLDHTFDVRHHREDAGGSGRERGPFADNCVDESKPAADLRLCRPGRPIPLAPLCDPPRFEARHRRRLLRRSQATAESAGSGNVRGVTKVASSLGTIQRPLVVEFARPVCEERPGDREVVSGERELVVVGTELYAMVPTSST